MGVKMHIHGHLHSVNWYKVSKFTQKIIAKHLSSRRPASGENILVPIQIKITSFKRNPDLLPSPSSIWFILESHMSLMIPKETPWKKVSWLLPTDTFPETILCLVQNNYLPCALSLNNSISKRHAHT